MLHVLISLQFILRFQSMDAMNGFLTGVEKDESVKVLDVANGFPAVVVETEEEYINDLKKRFFGIAYVQKNYEYKALYIPNDPYFLSEQWGNFAIDLTRAWNITRGSRSITIAIIDEGVDYNHSELRSQFGAYKGYDFVDEDSDPAPDASDEAHGTHVAGIIAATMDNSLGVAGVGNFTLIAYRAMDETGSGRTIDIFEAMIEASRNPDVRVVNMSLGGTAYDSLLREGIDSLLNRNKVVVAAAGNNGGAVNYPAAFEGVIAVSAWDTSSTIADFSSRGEEVDVAAPGVGILSTYPGNRLAWMDGTSMATPYVSGVVGLMLSLNPNLTPQDVRDILCVTAVDVLDEGEDIYTGCGLLNAYGAVEAVQGR